MANIITEEQILKVIRAKNEPELDRDVVSLGWLRDLKVDNGNVTFRLVLPVPIFPSKREFARSLDQAISALPGVKSVEPLAMISAAADVWLLTTIAFKPFGRSPFSWTS